MSLPNDLTDFAQRLAALESRVTRMEESTLVIAEAQKAQLSLLADMQQRLGDKDREQLTGRIFAGLEKVSLIYPKERTIIYVGRDYFGDNVKYAFLDMVAHAKQNNVACYYLTHDQRQYNMLTQAGLPCLPVALTEWTTQHMHIMLSASVAVMGSIFHPSNEQKRLYWSLLRGAKTVQLWHGLPLKEIGMECLYTPATFGPQTAEMLAASGPFDIFVGTSKASEAAWARRFKFQHFAATGYPRMDALMRPATPQDLLNTDTDSLHAMEEDHFHHRPVILYVPTFRDHKLGTWLNDIGLEQIISDCAAKDWSLYINLHPFEAAALPALQARYPSLRFIKPETDIYPLLKQVDAMVTDYSSLAFDFLPLERPIIHFCPDHDDYIAQARPLIAGYEKLLCGPIVTRATDLSTAIEAALSAAHNTEAVAHQDARSLLRQQLFDHADNQAAARVSKCTISLM